jgi:glycosyltransferase involved in cell wall biosynthesis
MDSAIAIVSLGAKLKHEKIGYARYRLLANMLADRGYSVDLIVGGFQDGKRPNPEVIQFQRHDDDRFNLVVIPEPAPGKDIVRRPMRGYSAAAKGLEKHFHDRFRYDLVYAEVPPNDVALVAGSFAQRHNIPFVVDVTDLWPEECRPALGVPILKTARALPFLRDARKAYDLAAAAVGTSKEFAMRPFADRPNDIPHLVVYLGTDLATFDEGVVHYGSHVDKREGEYWVTYAGALLPTSGLDHLVVASMLLEEHGYRDIRMRILGSGPQEKSLRALASDLDAPVDFLGWLPYQCMAAHLRKSDVMVNSHVRKAPRSVGAKIADYLASGHPVVNTSASEEVCDMMRSREIGINVAAEDPEVLASAIAFLHDNPVESQEMGLRARIMAEEEFDRPRAYRPIVSLVDSLLEQ